MRKFAGLVILLLALEANSQVYIDSLRKELASASSDSARFDISRQMYTYYEEINRDSALALTDYRLLLVQKNKRVLERAYVLGQRAYQLAYLARFGEALKCLIEGFEIAEDKKYEGVSCWPLTYYKLAGTERLMTLSMLHHMMGHLMRQTNNIRGQIAETRKGRDIAWQINNKFRIVVGDMVLGSAYLGVGNVDSAFYFAKEGEQAAVEGKIYKYLGFTWFILADVYYAKKDIPTALTYYRKAIDMSMEQGAITHMVGNYIRLFEHYNRMNNSDSMLHYALLNYEMVSKMGTVISGMGMDMNMGRAYQFIYKAYAARNEKDSAYKYAQLALITNDSINAVRLRNLSVFQQLSIEEQQRLQQIEKKQAAYQNQLRLYGLIAGIVMLSIIAFFLWRNNRNRRKANNILQEQKTYLQETLAELKNTQAQLIQSEKMASLGELTAGIAHEIQNPLNFVNNFSELSLELVEEVKGEKLKVESERDKQLEDELLSDITANLEKINHHGKRADSIVKGMLQHSRSSAGQKEATDINALADEYLRLAYHGVRAKDKDFNVKLETNFDTSLPKINIVPQDMGRVLMNLLTNAFYAVDERRQQTTDDGPQQEKNINEEAVVGGQWSVVTYQPIVSITTKNNSNTISITITDNGSGIPGNIQSKIFQPFFTTKPTGQGTGLGLSLAYDIVKAHGGEIELDSTIYVGTTFLIKLPLIN